MCVCVRVRVRVRCLLSLPTRAVHSFETQHQSCASLWPWGIWLKSMSKCPGCCATRCNCYNGQYSGYTCYDFGGHLFWLDITPSGYHYGWRSGKGNISDINTLPLSVSRLVKPSAEQCPFQTPSWDLTSQFGGRSKKSTWKTWKAYPLGTDGFFFSTQDTFKPREPK